MTESISPLRGIKEELKEAKENHVSQIKKSFDELSQALLPIYNEHIFGDAPIKFIPTKLEKTKGRNTIVFTIVDPAEPGVNIGPLISDMTQSDALHNFRIEFPSFTTVSASFPQMPRYFKKSLQQVLKDQSHENAKEFFSRLNRVHAQWRTRNNALLEKHAKLEDIEKRLAELQAKPGKNGDSITKRNERSKLLKELCLTYLPAYKQFTQKRLAKLSWPKSRLPNEVSDQIAAYFDEQYNESQKRTKPTVQDYPNLTKLVTLGIADLPINRLTQYMKKARKPTFYGDVQKTEKAIASGVPEEFALAHYLENTKKVDSKSAWELKKHPFDEVLLATQLCPRPKAALTLLEKAQQVQKHLPSHATSHVAIAISRALGREEPNPENIVQVVNGEKSDAFLKILSQIPDATTHLASLDSKKPVVIIPRPPASSKKVVLPQPQATKQKQLAVHDRLVWSDEVMDEIKKQPFTAGELAKAMIYGFNLANAKRKAIGEVYFKQSDIKKHVFANIGNDGPKYRAMIKFLDSHGLIIAHKTGSDAPLSLDLNESNKTSTGKAVAAEVKRFMFEVRK